MHRRVVMFLGVLVSACVLAGCGGSGGPAGLDSKAVGVADAFTRLAFNEHNCRAASRYASNPQFCASLWAGGMVPVWSRFPLASHRIRRTGCGLGHLPADHQSVVGCIEYTASSGFRIHYGMTHAAQGWRIVEFGLSPGTAGSYAARLDRQAVAVADVFTRMAWNKHDCGAGRRYLLPGLAGGVCPASPAAMFPLKSHRIRPNSCGHSDWNGGYRISPGCIVYTASNGETLEYGMTKTPQGWRIIETGTSSASG